MPPNRLLLADPAIRVAGLRVPPAHRVGKVERAPLGVRWLALAALLIVLAGAFGYLRTFPPLATVMSGSMAPTINTGDIVVLKKLDGPAQVGEIVVVHVPDEARARYGYPTVVIHRVRAIGPDGLVTTKGDARKEPDPFTVPREALTEKVVTHLPAAGQFLGFFTSTLGLLWLAGGVVLFVVPSLMERSKRGATEREQRLEEAIQAAAAAQTMLAEHLADLPARLEQIVARPAGSADAEPVVARATGGAVAASVAEPIVARATGGAVAASVAAAKPEFVVIPARPVPPAPPVPSAPEPTHFTLRATAPRVPGRDERPVRQGPARSHGALCAVGGP
jgi:signal peptidase I